MLQGVAVCCSVGLHMRANCLFVLRCVAACCSVFQSGITYEGELPICVAVCCGVLQSVALCCSVLQCVAVYRRMLRCAADYSPCLLTLYSLICTAGLILPLFARIKPARIFIFTDNPAPPHTYVPQFVLCAHNDC